MKSTFAYQFSRSFLENHNSGLVVYLDTEGSGSVKSNEFRISRIDTFGLKTDRFRYHSIVCDIPSVYELIEMIVKIKKVTENKTKKSLSVLFIWDSISSTTSSKSISAESADKVIGHKSRELTHYLEKINPFLKFNKITFIAIDQVRADMKIEGPYVHKEQTTGVFGGVKCATNTFALQHNAQQWLFFSKGKQISPAEGLGIDGWFIHLHVEKNKIAPSKHNMTCIFDKHTGIDKFWTEFYYMMQKTKGEEKIFKNKNLNFPLLIKKTGTRYYLEVPDPTDPKNVYKSDPFYRKDAKKKYETDSEFKTFFDFGVEQSAYNRIVKGLFKVDMSQFDDDNCVVSNPESFIGIPENGDVTDIEDQNYFEEVEYDNSLDINPEDNSDGDNTEEFI